MIIAVIIVIIITDESSGKVYYNIRRNITSKQSRRIAAVNSDAIRRLIITEDNDNRG